MLQVALIHNQEPERIAAARRCAELLYEETGLPFAKPNEIFWQPKTILSLGSLHVFICDVRFCRLLARWSKRLGRKYPGWFYALKFFITTRLPDYISTSRLRSRCRRRAIEILLTFKHIQAWEAFLQTDSQYLAVMESDVAMTEGCGKRINDQLLQLLSKLSQSGLPAFFDIAGGCTDEDLGTSALNSYVQNGFKEFDKAITNTTCSYIINKPLAELFVSVLVRRPMWREINSDWLINQLFISLEETGIYALCFHAMPPIFKHGSVEAIYASEIR